MLQMQALWLWAPLALADTCERATTVVDVEATVVRARSAYEAGDHIALAAAVVDGETALACVVEPVPPSVSEALHLAVGLWVTVGLGEQAAVPYLARAGLGRDGDGLAIALTEAERGLADRLGPQLSGWTASSGGLITPPLRGLVTVDGRHDARQFPAEAPFVMQRVAGDNVLATHYVRPQDRPPTYSRRRPVLATTTGVLVGTTGGLLVGAVLARQRVFSTEGDPLTFDQLRATQSVNQGLLIAAGATSLSAGISGTALALTYRR